MSTRKREMEEKLEILDIKIQYINFKIHWLELTNYCRIKDQ